MSLTLTIHTNSNVTYNLKQILQDKNIAMDNEEKKFME